jgi:hypothetical protein
MTGEQKWFAAICPKHFVNGISEQDGMIKDGDLRVFGGGD